MQLSINHADNITCSVSLPHCVLQHISHSSGTAEHVNKGLTHWALELGFTGRMTTILTQANYPLSQPLYLLSSHPDSSLIIPQEYQRRHLHYNAKAIETTQSCDILTKQTTICMSQNQHHEIHSNTIILSNKISWTWCSNSLSWHLCSITWTFLINPSYQVICRVHEHILLYRTTQQLGIRVYVWGSVLNTLFPMSGASSAVQDDNCPPDLPPPYWPVQENLTESCHHVDMTEERKLRSIHMMSFKEVRGFVNLQVNLTGLGLCAL